MTMLRKVPNRKDFQGNGIGPIYDFESALKVTYGNVGWGFSSIHLQGRGL
jgi:hypothetical protein